MVAALVLALTFVAIRRRRIQAGRNDEHPSPPQTADEVDIEHAASDPPDNYDEARERTLVTEVEELELDEIPPFNSLLFQNQRPEGIEAADISKETGNDGDVSALLFRLLSTKAQICELERAERSMSAVLESTCQVLDRLKGSLNDSSTVLREEIEEMHELLTGELSATRQSILSVLELKEIINSQCDLLMQPGAAHSAEFLSTKLSYAETIDASLDRRLKNAERREMEFEHRKGRIMTLRKEMLNIMDGQADTAQPH